MLPQQPKNMRDLPRNSRVRRRLFPDDGSADEAKKDNYDNILLETINSDQIKYSIKYNFDFKNDKPLEGKYEWSKGDKFDWIGRKSDNVSDVRDIVENEVEILDKESPLDIKQLNEATPRIRHVETVPIAKKRKIDVELDGDKSVRRKIDFK